MSSIGQLIHANRTASDRFSARYPDRIDGSQQIARIVLEHVEPGMSLFDVGGGKVPLLRPELKRRLEVTVTGVDIDADELARAPEGAYDRTIASDIATLEGHDEEADLLYSRSVAEHVERPEAMFATAFRLLRPGGLSIHFMPNKWALFALVNRALPHTVRERMLYGTQPEQRARGCFKPYYRRTYPSAIERMLGEIGYSQVDVVPYYHADYLSFVVPLHVAYVGWQNMNRRLRARNLCESFIVLARR
jgi:2-polyprenyl-6-hydroxyphenyl methylase/3-demethylubiquinone-9 3-methyltransferase